MTAKLKCKDVDIIEFIEGNASEDTSDHIQGCRNCKTEAERLSEFSRLFTIHYAEGRKLDKELDNKLQSISISAMKRLPDNIAQKVTTLKERTLKSKLKKVISKSTKDARDVKNMMESFLTPRVQPMPASPKDITKTKAKKKKTAKKGKKK